MTSIVNDLILAGSRDYITTGGQIIIALIVMLGSVLVAFIQFGVRAPAKRTAQAAATAAEAASQAVENTQTVSNGRIPRMEVLLEQIAAEQRAAQQRDMELAKDIGGLRSDIRDVRADARAERTRLSKHLDSL